MRVQPAHPGEAHRELGSEHDLDSALSHVETRRVANDYTIRFRGKSYQIDRKAIVPGLRNSRVRVERRLDGVLAARFGKHELALKRCGAQPQSERPQPKSAQAESVQAEPASAAAEKAGGQAADKPSSDWMKDFDLKDSPGTMPSKTKNPLAEAMRELKADPTPAARPVVRTTLAGKAKPRRGEDTRIIAGHFGRRSSPATPCTGRPGEEHGPRTAAGSLERPVPETQSPTDCLMLAVL